MLLASGEPPGIIDFSPHWRPPSFAEGAVIADVLSWHEAPATLLDELDLPLAAVSRGLVSRIRTTSCIRTEPSRRLADEIHRYGSALDALGL